MIGTPLPQPDPRGWLAYTELPPALQNAEDSTANADAERLRFHRRHTFERPATATERALLLDNGHGITVDAVTTLPEDLITCVEFITPSLRARTWPRLEGEQS